MCSSFRESRGSSSHRRTRSPLRSAGQALVEFAIVAPVLVVLLVGTLEVALLMFSHVAADFAVGDAARVAAAEGNSSNADGAALQVIRDSALGHTRLAQITEVDIYRLVLNPSTGAITPDPTAVNQYHLDGSAAGSQSWPYTARNVSSSSSDFLGITIIYTYPWQTGLLGPIHAPQLRAIYYQRLEPQTN